MQNKSIKPEPEYFKCPECGHRTELEYSGAISITKCERCRLFGNRNLWDKWADSERSCLEWRKAYDCLETELERTRKALDVAVDALKRANNTYCAEEEDITIDLTESAAHKWQRTAYQMEMPISIALEQITALEQKESAFVHNKIEFPEYNDGLLEEFDKQFFENGQNDDLTETAPEQKDE